MPRIRTFVTVSIAIVLSVITAPVVAQDLILHLPLDGNLNYSGRTGEPRFVLADGASQPTFVPGRYGQALSFDSKAAVIAPFNLDHAEYPRVTITAWVREEAGASNSRDIFSSTSTAGARMGIHGGRLAARLGDRGVSNSDERIPAGEWVFVAAVIDTTEGSVQLYQDDAPPYLLDVINVSTSPPPLQTDPDAPGSDPTAWVAVGAMNFDPFSTASRPLIIDDVRVYGSALTAEQVGGIREASNSAVGQTATAVNLESTNVQSDVSAAATGLDTSVADGDFVQTACNSHSECPEGTYCAWDHTCHPDRHAPMTELNLMVEPVATLDAPMEFDDPSSSGGIPLPVGPPQLTALSGKADKRTYNMDFVDKFLTKIVWEEDGDRPCSIRIEGFGETDGELAKDFGGCGGGVLFNNPGVVELPTTGITDDYFGRGVGGLQVCSSLNANRRMKGLRIAGNWIANDGSIIGSNLEDEFERTNCGEWQAMVLCAPSSIATGIVVHYYRRSNGNEEIQGLQLICRAIEVRN